MVEEKVAWAEIAQHFNRSVKKCKNKLKRVQAKPVKIEKIKKAIQEQTIAPKKNIEVQAKPVKIEKIKKAIQKQSKTPKKKKQYLIK